MIVQNCEHCTYASQCISIVKFSDCICSQYGVLVSSCGRGWVGRGSGGGFHFRETGHVMERNMPLKNSC